MPVRCNERGKRPRTSKGRPRACSVGTLFARDFSRKGDARVVRARGLGKSLKTTRPVLEYVVRDFCGVDDTVVFKRLE